MSDGMTDVYRTNYYMNKKLGGPVLCTVCGKYHPFPECVRTGKRLLQVADVITETYFSYRCPECTGRWKMGDRSGIVVCCPHCGEPLECSPGRKQ